MAMAGAPLPLSKHTAQGRESRRSLLEGAGIRLPANERGADVLDAAAVAWSAGRIALGSAAVLPDPPETGTDGLQIAIRWLSGHDNAPESMCSRGRAVADAKVASRRKAQHGSSRTVFHEGSG
jgi:Protein of unknown function (DUF429)